MPTLREIRNHMASVRGVAKVTRALELVSIAKHQRLQARLLNTRAFATKSWEVLQHLRSAQGAVSQRPVFSGYGRIDRAVLVLITTSRGMVGRHDDDIVALAMRFVRKQAPAETQFVTLGRIGRDAVIQAGHTVHADFSMLDDHITIEDVNAVARVLLDGFESGYFQLASMAFAGTSTLGHSEPTLKDLLPVSIGAPSATREYIYEPDPETILTSFIPRILCFQLYEAFLEAITSENAARAAAMRTASRNAGDLIAHLTLTYNKARQQSITAELLDVLRGRYGGRPQGAH